jgi:branched-chain amino acid transport system substrate-binding protein
VKLKNIITLFLIFNFFHSGFAEEKAPIKLGCSIALSGQLADYGKKQSNGSITYFSKINDQGGINGRKIDYIVMDDQYEPLIAAQNVRKLITQNVLAFVGNQGSPSALVTLPIINKEHILLYAQQSGAQFLRKTPPDRYVINFFLGSDENNEITIKGLLDNGIKPEEIAFFTQNDPFGDAVYEGGMNALKKLGFPNPEKLPYGRYTRNTTNVEGGLSDILKNARINKFNIKIIITGAAPSANAAFAKLAYKFIPNAIIIATAGSINYKDFDEYEGNFIFSQYVPSPYDTSLPAIKEYQEDLKKYAPTIEPDFANLYGYLLAKLFTIALNRASNINAITREGIIDAFETLLEVDIGIGVKITINKDIHTALHNIFPMLIKKGKPKPFTWSDIPKLLQDFEKKPTLNQTN